MAGITPINNVPNFSLSGWKGSTLPTGYNNSMDIYEELVQMTDYLNQMGLLVNSVADQWNQITTWITEDGLNQMVIAELNKWVQNGTFTKILEDTALADITKRLNNEIDTRASEDVRIQNALQANIDNVVKDMSNLVGAIKNNLQGQIDTLNNRHTADVTNLSNTIGSNDTKQSQNVNALKKQFQNEIDHMANGAPVAAYDTLTELQNAFPNGASGAYLVIQDGYVYFWRNNAWEKAVKYNSDTSSQTNLAGMNTIVYTDGPIDVVIKGKIAKINFPSGKVWTNGKEYDFVAQSIDWSNSNFIFFVRDTATFVMGGGVVGSVCVGATSVDDKFRPFLQMNANFITYNGLTGDRNARLSDAYRMGVAMIITDDAEPIWFSMDGKTAKIPSGHIYCGRDEYKFDATTVNIGTGYLCFNRQTKQFMMGNVDWISDWIMVGWIGSSTLHASGTLTPHLYGNPDWYVSEDEDQLETGQIYKPADSTEVMSAANAMLYPTAENGQIVVDTNKKTISFPDLNVACAGHEYFVPAQSFIYNGSGWVVFNRNSKTFTLSGPTEKNWYITVIGYLKVEGKTKLYLQIPDDYISIMNTGSTGGNETTNLNAGFLTDSFGVHIRVDKDYIDYLQMYLERKGYALNINRNSIGGTQLTKRTGRTDSFSERINSFTGSNEDILVIQGGTNDWGAGNPLGTINDTNPETFMGAMDYIINQANANFPEIQIYFALPIDRWDNDSTAPGEKNSIGLTIDDYINAMKQVCTKYNVPYIDLQKETGIYPWKNGTATLIDRLHPTELGHQRIARAIISHIGY